jgi:mRNA interferase HicA
MKRRLLLKHLSAHGCYLLREGKKHSIFVNPGNGQTVAVPRHTEVADLLARILCDDLGIPRP